MPCNSHSYVVNLPTKQALKTLSSPPSIPVKAEPQLIPFHASSFSLYLGPCWVAPDVSCVLLDLTVINPFLPQISLIFFFFLQCICSHSNHKGGSSHNVDSRWGNVSGASPQVIWAQLRSARKLQLIASVFIG